MHSSWPVSDLDWGPFLESPDNFFGPGKLFYVRDVSIKDSNSVVFEIWAMKF